MAGARIRIFRVVLGLLGGFLVALGAYAYGAPGLEASLRLPACLMLGGAGAILIGVGLLGPPHVVRRAVEDMFDGD